MAHSIRAEAEEEPKSEGFDTERSGQAIARIFGGAVDISDVVT